MFAGEGNEKGSNVTVKKEELLEELKKNREKHTNDVAEARAEYKAALLAHFEAQLALVKEGKHANIMQHVPFGEPDDHTTDYDRVIKMVSMSTSPTINMTEQEFSKYVMDDWEWKHHFMMTKSAYAVAAGK